MFGDTMTVCVYEKAPNIIGLITKKNSKPDAKSKIWLLIGLLDEEARAASIRSPNRTTADTSINPVKTETIPDKKSTGNLPFRAQWKKLRVLEGGGPSAFCL